MQEDKTPSTRTEHASGSSATPADPQPKEARSSQQPAEGPRGDTANPDPADLPHSSEEPAEGAPDKDDG